MSGDKDSAEDSEKAAAGGDGAAIASTTAKANKKMEEEKEKLQAEKNTLFDKLTKSNAKVRRENDGSTNKREKAKLDEQQKDVVAFREVEQKNIELSHLKRVHQGVR